MIGTITTILEAATSGLAIATRNGLVEVADFDGRKLPSKRKGKDFVPVVGDKFGSLSYWRQPDKIRSRIVQGGVGAEEELSFTLRWVAMLSRAGEGPCEDIGGAMNAVRQSVYMGKGAIKSTLSASFVQCEVTSIDLDSDRVFREELGDKVLPMQWRMVAMEVTLTIRSKPGCLPSCLDTVIPTVGAVPVGCVEPSRLCSGGATDAQVLTWDAGLQQYVPKTPGSGPSGSGDVVGPASAVNNNFAAFNTTTGKLIKDSGSNASSFDPAGAASAAQAAAIAASQPLDSDLTAYANAADAAARRALIGAGVGDVTGGGTASGTNTGDQDLSPYQTIAGLAAAVRSTVLTGLSLATNQAIAAGDSILQALGYLQAQITDRYTKAQSDARYMSYGVATAAQGPGFATDTLITGSVVAIPSGALKAGTAYRLRCSLNKTAAGTATPIFQVRLGTNGTTADTSRTTLTFGAGTAAADDGVFELMVTFRSVGGGTSAVIVAHGVISHRLNTTGLTNGSYNAVTGNVSAGFDSTADTFISVSLNAGTSAAWSISQVHAQLFNQN